MHVCILLYGFTLFVYFDPGTLYDFLKIPKTHPGCSAPKTRFLGEFLKKFGFPGVSVSYVLSKFREVAELLGGRGDR